jgi:hypothetical protein
MSCQLHIPAVLPSRMRLISDLLSPKITFVNLAEVRNLVAADIQTFIPQMSDPDISLVLKYLFKRFL